MSEKLHAFWEKALYFPFLFVLIVKLSRLNLICLMCHSIKLTILKTLLWTHMRVSIFIMHTFMNRNMHLINYVICHYSNYVKSPPTPRSIVPRKI